MMMSEGGAHNHLKVVYSLCTLNNTTSWSLKGLPHEYGDGGADVSELGVVDAQCIRQLL